MFLALGIASKKSSVYYKQLNTYELLYDNRLIILKRSSNEVV